MNNDNIKVNFQNQIAFITLNEPNSLNALSNRLKEKLISVLEKIEKNNDIKLIILKGDGKAFCAGGDIRAMQDPYDPLKINDGMNLSKDIVMKIRTMPKLIITVVHGFVAGAGMSLALATDVIFAEENTKFLLSFQNVGLIPDLGLHYYLPRKIGEWKAKEWIWEGITLSVEEAIEYGFVKEEVSKGKVLDKATEFSQKLVNGPIDAYITSKLIINNSGSMKIEDVMERENNMQSILRGSKAHKNALKDFIKRKR